MGWKFGRKNTKEASAECCVFYLPFYFDSFSFSKPVFDLWNFALLSFSVVYRIKYDLYEWMTAFSKDLAPIFQFFHWETLCHFTTTNPPRPVSLYLWLNRKLLLWSFKPLLICDLPQQTTTSACSPAPQCACCSSSVWMWTVILSLAADGNKSPVKQPLWKSQWVNIFCMTKSVTLDDVTQHSATLDDVTGLWWNFFVSTGIRIPLFPRLQCNSPAGYC